MKVAAKCAAAMLCFVLMVPVVRSNALSVSAKAAVLLCAETQEVLFAKDAHRRLPMASTTKIMTALLTLEAGEPERVVHVTQEMTAVEGTSMGLLAGDSVSLYALACGMLLSSGNDAANTAAIALDGSAAAFADRMNARAQQIGMQNTHFVTPSGLDDEAHYSTAFDMALLACTALHNPVFQKICASACLTVQYGNPPYSRRLTNHNRLLQSYSGCIGVKTGFTKKSGRCLVSAAQRDGVTLIAVTLSAPDDWADHAAMLDYGFSRVHAQQAETDVSQVRVPVVGGGLSHVSVYAGTTPDIVEDTRGGEIRYEVYLPHFVYAPVSRGDVLGRVEISRGDKVLAVSPVLAARDIPAMQPKTQEKQSFFRKWIEKIKGVF